MRAEWKRIIWKIWTEGDPSVGIPGDEADVLMNVFINDKEFMEMMRASLKKFFEDVWDFKVHVMTEDEFNEYTKEED
jgi:hypothetical protein